MLLLIKRVGIFAGTFDPIHVGHLAFARAAMAECKLDKVFFLVEPRPRRKQGVRALEHREALVRLAIADEKKFGMIVLEQVNFSVEETLPKLQALFEGAELHMLLGEDVFAHLNSWPHVKKLLTAARFIVGIRKSDQAKMEYHLHAIEKARNLKFNVLFLATENKEVSSSKIRLALKHGKKPIGLLSETHEYIKQNGLYSSDMDSK